MAPTWVIVVLSLIVVVEVETQESLFTWMTPYNVSSPANWDDVLKGVPATCKLKQVQYIGRHGMRNPSDSQIEAVQAITVKLASFIQTLNNTSGARSTTARRIQSVASWQSQLEGGETLRDKGEHELKFLANDFYRLFERYNLNGTLMFTSTNTMRAISSSAVFRTHWPGNSTAEFTILPNMIDHDRLSYFSTCSRYVETIKNNITTRPEFGQIHETPLAQQLVEDFNNRLFGPNLARRISLDFQEIFSLYFMLGYETAIFGNSTLANLFTQSDLEFFDYADDVESWWKQSAYAYSLNAEAACALTKFIFGLAPVAPNQYGGSKSGFPGVFQFTHSESLVPLITLFGLFKDDDSLKGNATFEEMRQRKFKGSIITPFSANLAFLFFDCPSDENARMIEQNVALLVNQKLYRLPNVCPNSDLCPLDKVRAYYNSTIRCNLTEACQHTPSMSRRWGAISGTAEMASTLTMLILGLIILVSV